MVFGLNNWKMVQNIDFLLLLEIKKVGVFSEGNIRNPVYGSLVTLFSQPLNIV